MIEAGKNYFTSKDASINTCFNKLVLLHTVTSGCDLYWVFSSVTYFINQVAVLVMIWCYNCYVYFVSPCVNFLVKLYSCAKVRCENGQIDIFGFSSNVITSG